MTQAINSCQNMHIFHKDSVCTWNGSIHHSHLQNHSSKESLSPVILAINHTTKHIRQAPFIKFKSPREITILLAIQSKILQRPYVHGCDH